MIGKYLLGKSFRGCLLYCLHDKLPTRANQEVMEDRAKVIWYNQCFGSDKELIRQFHEVRLLNQKVAKPVLHITLSLVPGEEMTKEQWANIAESCAHHFGFAANQYVAILHHDTTHQHLHIVANRIGFNGKTVSDSNSYQKMALCCRKMERENNLQQVLSPTRFLPKEQRQMPRIDQRKEQLKESIKECLASSHSYGQFEERMQAMGYKISKGRGIAFTDEKEVKVKGSEVGYSWSRVEQVLRQNFALQQQNKLEKIPPITGVDKKDVNNGDGLLNHRERNREGTVEKGIREAIDLLLSNQKEQQVLVPEWLKKKRYKNRQRPH